MLGPVVFTATFFALAAGWRGYSAIRQQISVLAAAPGGLGLDVAFVVSALLMLIGVIGLRGSLFADLPRGRLATVTTMLLIPLVGMLICGFFPFDSPAAFMHVIGANIACAFPVIGFTTAGCLVWATPGHRMLGIALVAAGALTALALAGYFTSAPLEDIRTVAGGGTLGLWERILVIEIFAWYVLLGVLGATTRREAGARPAGAATGVTEGHL